METTIETKQDGNIYVCDCGLKATRKMIKRGPNAGGHFYSCSKWPHDHCSYFKSEDVWDDGGSEGKIDGERRTPRERYEWKTEDLLYKESGDTFLTPFSSSFVSLLFIDKLAQKTNVPCVESTFYEREIEGIDVIAKTKGIKKMQFMPILPGFGKVYNAVNCKIKVLPLRKYWHTFNYYPKAPRITNDEDRNTIIEMYNNVMSQHNVIEEGDNNMESIYIPIKTMTTKSSKSESWITKTLATHFAIQIEDDKFLFMDRNTFNIFLTEIEEKYLLHIFNGSIARIPVSDINKKYTKYII